MTTAASSVEGSVASATGLSRHTLRQADRDVVARALGRYGTRRTLAERGGIKTSLVTSPRMKSGEKTGPGRRGETPVLSPRSASVRRNLCLYCGQHAKQRGFCHAHSDLPARDPLFRSVLACTQGGSR